MPDGGSAPRRRRGGHRGRPTVGAGVVDWRTGYAEDFAARVFVREHPHGADPHVIAAALGVSRESVRLTIRDALLRVERELRAVGIDGEDLADVMARRDDSVAWSQAPRVSRARIDKEDRAQDRRIGRGPQSPDVIRWFRGLVDAEKRAQRAIAAMEEDRCV